MNETFERSEPAPQDLHDQQAPLYASLAHLAAFAGLFFPFGHILGPFVVWLLKKDEPFVDDQGKEAMNFQISITIYIFIALLGLLMFMFLVSGNIHFVHPMIFLGLMLFVATLLLADAIVVIVAAIKSRDGVPFRYPMCMRFVSPGRSS